MYRKLLTRIGVPLALFIIGGALSLFALQKWGHKTEAPRVVAQDGLGDIPGLATGDVVALPELPRLQGGGTVALGRLQEKYLLLALVSTSCAGCARDSDFWKQLGEEAARRRVAFYLISVDDDRERVERFAQANSFEGLPVLFDPDKQVPSRFKVKFVPQYILLKSNGQVVGRWNGLRNYDAKRQGEEKLTELFDPITEK